MSETDRKGRDMMIEIREARAADADKMIECCKALGAESDNLTFGAEGIPFSVEQEAEFLEKLHKSDKDYNLIAVDGDEVVATASISCYGKKRLAHRGELSIAVRKLHCGRHIGSEMMAKMLEFAKHTAKAEIISLEVRSDNERAKALYKKFGFETIGIFDGFMKINGEYVSCDIMRLAL